MTRKDQDNAIETAGLAHRSLPKMIIDVFIRHFLASDPPSTTIKEASTTITASSDAV